MKFNISIFLAFVAVMSLATGGIFVKLSSLQPINTAFYRILISLFFLFPFVYKNLRKIDRKSYIIILCSGIFLAIDLILWNKSFLLTSVANANLFVNLVPFTTIPLSYFLFKERPSSNFLFGLVICILGIGVLMFGKFQVSAEGFQGDFLAFLASIFYGFFLLSVYKVRSKVDAPTLMFISGLGSIPILAVAAEFSENIMLPSSTHEWYILLGLALCSQIFGQGLLSYCLGKINILLSSVIILSQPVFAAIYAYFIFKETLSIQELGGIIIILFGVYFAKKEKKKNSIPDTI
ncbi:DMT family transporter [Chryseobacterium scophthalmum]|uniref:Threonine/homoserine efflux transporter RhtA n=1 Tax=Chryseobacterium scophthalmum TaxID=59733 RepID=A0A1N6H6K4_9FLAO|nr:DMT family transporter [Chryseobacterium scophthalmum]SIO15383.1 Threonine/homoserine efflux transporter RhtA [Chryseobacterium scophthalmum]